MTCVHGSTERCISLFTYTTCDYHPPPPHTHTQCVAPIKSGKPRDEAKCTELRAKLKSALDITESHFLKDRKFIGGDQISIADLQFLCEITQYWLSDNNIYKGRPNVERWVADCQTALAPHFDSIYSYVYEVRKSGRLHAEIDVSP